MQYEIFKGRGYAVCPGGRRKIYPSCVLRCIRQTEKYIHYDAGLVLLNMGLLSMPLQSQDSGVKHIPIFCCIRLPKR